MNEPSFTSGLHMSLGFQQAKVISALAQSFSCRANLCLHLAKRDVLQAREGGFKQDSPLSLQGQKIPALHRASNRLEFDLHQGAERIRPKSFSMRCPPLHRPCGKAPHLGKWLWPTRRKREGIPGPTAAPFTLSHSAGQPEVLTRPRGLPRGPETRSTTGRLATAAALLQPGTRHSKRHRRPPRAWAPPLTREGEAASLAQANILGGGVPGGNNPVSLQRKGRRWGDRGDRRRRRWSRIPQQSHSPAPAAAPQTRQTGTSVRRRGGAGGKRPDAARRKEAGRAAKVTLYPLYWRRWGLHSPRQLTPAQPQSRCARFTTAAQAGRWRVWCGPQWQPGTWVRLSTRAWGGSGWRPGARGRAAARWGSFFSVVWRKLVNRERFKALRRVALRRRRCEGTAERHWLVKPGKATQPRPAVSLRVGACWGAGRSQAAETNPERLRSQHGNSHRQKNRPSPGTPEVFKTSPLLSRFCMMSRFTCK